MITQNIISTSNQVKMIYQKDLSGEWPLKKHLLLAYEKRHRLQ